MSNRNRVVLAFLWALSLVAVGQWTSAQTAQTPRPDPTMLEQAVVYSGEDIGFRLTQPMGREPVGRLVVRIAGKWREVDIQPVQGR